MSTQRRITSEPTDAITSLGQLARARRHAGWSQEQQNQWFSDLIRDLPESELLDAAIHIADSVSGWCSPRSRIYPVAAPSVLSDLDQPSEAAPEGNEGALGAA